jgi:hypothetical protein
MIEPPTVAVLGVPGMKIAPTPPGGLLANARRHEVEPCRQVPENHG